MNRFSLCGSLVYIFRSYTSVAHVYFTTTNLCFTTPWALCYRMIPSIIPVLCPLTVCCQITTGITSIAKTTDVLVAQFTSVNIRSIDNCTVKLKSPLKALHFSYTSLRYLWTYECMNNLTPHCTSYSTVSSKTGFLWNAWQSAFIIMYYMFSSYHR